MKKSIIVAALIAALAGAAAFADGVENKTNMNPGYLRNPSRNAEAKRPEAVFYNIAGTGFLEDGLYFDAGNQFVFKKYTNSFPKGAIPLYPNGKDFSDKTAVWLYPNADIVYKHGPFAVFGNFGIYAGGGKLSYKDGTTATAAALATHFPSSARNHSVELSSMTYGEQVGFTYCLKNFISFSGALRLLQATQSMELKSDDATFVGVNQGNKISYDASAFGIGGVFGINVRPFPALTLSTQFQLHSDMKYEVKNAKGMLGSNLGIVDGETFHTDLPAALNMGAGYQVLKPLYVSASFNYYFNSFAQLNSVFGKSDYSDSWELAAGADYDINDKVTASLGLSYGNRGTKDTVNSAFSPVLDSLAIGTGVEYRPIDNLTLTLGLMYIQYFKQDYYIGGGAVETKLNKQVFITSIGAAYRLPI
ncbi:outer membrane protein transport protein [Treponema socranskii subsp. buccale]|uniref:OmpP1/FadL family transporter n=1 Tax=Treponema socranskii TaxID=53419 RepID=UPI0020A527AE|nr:outer membrane protein transport protein [Treponema socranskii]UTD03501.1 outer membrane protein transport protein [Treponema socranskii subsp. buccale]